MTVALLCATDDVYAKGLAVTVRSALHNLGPGRRLRLYLVDGGLSPSTRTRLQRSFEHDRLTVEWLQPEMAALRSYPTSHHISPTAYLRLFAAELLPAELERVIYLDSDLVVRDDLGVLWDWSFGDSLCLAVQDPCSPFFNSAWLTHLETQGPYILKLRPVVNYLEAGHQDRQPYFNSGVLVINLKEWRNQKLAAQFRDCLQEHKEHIWCWDQYVLNFVLGGRWQPLPAHWNAGANIFEYPSWRETLLDKESFLRARFDPSLVHFTTSVKPWHGVSPHPFREEFFDYLDHTDWSGWRPRPDLSSLYNWVKWRTQLSLLRLVRRCDYKLATNLSVDND